VAHTLHCFQQQPIATATPTKAVRQQLTRSQVKVELCRMGGALSVERRLCLEIPAQAEYILLTQACYCLCKLTTRQGRFAIEACGSCVAYNLPLEEATPGNLVLRSAVRALQSSARLNRRLVKGSFTACKKTGAHEHSRKSPPHSSPVLF